MEQTLVLKDINQDQLKKIREILGEHSISVISKDERVMIVPTNEELLEEKLEAKYHEIASENFERKIKKIVSDFVDIHAIAFKNEGVKIPSYVAVITGEEYDDEAYFTDITGIQLYDENKKRYRCDIEIEYNGYEEDFEGALREEISDKFSAETIERYLGEELIEVE